MATITQLLRDTVTVINELTVNTEEEISKRLQAVVALNSTAKASTIERYMTFMNEHVFSKLSNENPLEDLRQLVPMIEKLVVLVSDDGLSLEEAVSSLTKTAALVQETVVEIQAAQKKPASFACLLATGKRIWPLLARLGHALKGLGSVCHGPVAVSVAAPVAAPVASPIELSSTEQPQPESEQAPAPHSLEGREAEPIPPASDNTDQKEETAN